VLFKKHHPIKQSFLFDPAQGTKLILTPRPCPAQAPNAESSSGKKISLFLILFLLALPLKGYGLEPSPAPSPVDTSSPLSMGVQVYQKLLSPVLASECYMQPSCSTYAKQALSKYGPFLGLLLTIDRLLHEANEDQTSPLVREGNKFKLYDPPSANVWWRR
jgi:putative component of membrane protein insertase Oxa1/YidC/SpoIIIJ protein YidD